MHEFGSFHTKLTRMQGQGLRPRSKAMCTSLINMTPSDTTTMKIAMLETKRLNKEIWSSKTISTADHQLYHVGLKVLWTGLIQNILMRTLSFVVGECTFG